MIDARKYYRAWRLCRSASIDLFAIDSPDTLKSIPGWDLLGLPVARDMPVPILEILRAIELRHEDAAEDPAKVRLVATLPASVRIEATTRDVAESLIRSALREVLVVGYSVREPEFLRLLINRGMAGVAVTVICDRGQDDGKALLESWPSSASPLRAFRGVEPAEGRSLLHAKTIVVDRYRTLLGSANFTAGGLRYNIELGVELTGTVSSEIVQLVERLIEGKWVEPVRSAVAISV